MLEEAGGADHLRGASFSSGRLRILAVMDADGMARVACFRRASEPMDGTGRTAEFPLGTSGNRASGSEGATMILSGWAVTCPVRGCWNPARWPLASSTAVVNKAVAAAAPRIAHGALFDAAQIAGDGAARCGHWRETGNGMLASHPSLHQTIFCVPRGGW